MTELNTKGRAAREASKALSMALPEVRSKALCTIASYLEKYMESILAANELDVVKAESLGTSLAVLDRLTLTAGRIKEIARGLGQVASLPEPLGEVMEIITRPNGLVIHKERVPLGVVGVIYEARPNVTADVAALCLRTGNAVMLRGSSSALNTNIAMVQVIQLALRECELPAEAVQLIEDTSRNVTDAFMRMPEHLDVLIPRGGQGLISHVLNNSTVPVLETGAGNCHIFIDKSALLTMAADIVLNAKTQRPAVCNAVETLLIHEAWGKENVLSLVSELRERGVDIYGCEKLSALDPKVTLASKADWETEYLDLRIAIKFVGSMEEAITHIEEYSTGHSECIISEDKANAAEFLQRVDAAVVYHNASTRFTDGYEFGLGAEIGISTQKLHARGPMGLRELTSYKFKVYGQGQVRG